MNRYNFSAAAPDEDIVFGACRPCHRRTPANSTVGDWIAFMNKHEIKRICCLLDQKLDRYDDLLQEYESAFGSDHVLHAPVTDFTVIDTDTFHDVSQFLKSSDQNSQRVVIHCSAGSGRTGHVLALWLASKRGYELDAAIATVERTGRNPLEAATKDQLAMILQQVS